MHVHLTDAVKTDLFFENMLHYIKLYVMMNVSKKMSGRFAVFSRKNEYGGCMKRCPT